MATYRCFTFGNFMLSSIQQGIQASHAITEMFVKYKKDSIQKNMLYDWAAYDKTLVCKNAGDADAVRGIYQFFSEENNVLPFGAFAESHSALDGNMTCISIIIPDRIYETGALLFRNKNVLFSLNKNTQTFTTTDMQGLFHEYTMFEYSLIELLNDTHLAR